MLETVSLGGRRVTIDRVGDGPPLVCLPGGPGFPGAQVGDLGGVSRARTLLRVDWRGAGQSDPPEDGRYGVDDFVADLAALQESLGLERLALLGHSFGGMVAATYAAAYPERVSHLVLDGTPDRLDDGREPVGGNAGYFAHWGEEPERYLDQLMAALYAPAWQWFEEHEFATCDLRPVLPAVTAKTLVITGDRDWAAGPERARAMAAQMRDAEAAVIPDAGHFAWLEQPAAYAERVLAFLADSLPG